MVNDFRNFVVELFGAVWTFLCLPYLCMYVLCTEHVEGVQRLSDDYSGKPRKIYIVRENFIFVESQCDRHCLNCFICIKLFPTISCGTVIIAVL